MIFDIMRKKAAAEMQKGVIIMDIKAKIEEIVKKLQSDKTLLAKFQKDPVKALEGLIGIDLPDEQLNAIITGVKAKLAATGVADLLGKFF